MQGRPNPPTGPKSRGGTRNSNARSRGGINKRRGDSPRVDRDGDLDMASLSSKSRRERGLTRGRANRPIPANGFGDHGHDQNRPPPRRGLFSGAALQKAIAQGLAAGDVKASTGRIGVDAILREVAGKSKGKHNGQETLQYIRVTGLNQSKAASNPDGGLRDLVAFLERKASSDHKKRESVRIRETHIEGDSVIITVRSEDVPKILRLNSFTFAATPLQIELAPNFQAPRKADAPSDAAVQTKQLLTDSLSRRYNPELKLLDLSALSKDPELVKIGTFDRTSTSTKFFTALMVICDEKFANPQAKRDAITSISLAHNELRNISMVASIANTLPDIKNIDLSSNKIEHMSSISGWRYKFHSLDHLVLKDNPLEKVEPAYASTVLRWYPSLRILDGVQVRSDQEVHDLTQKSIDGGKGKIPLPIQPALFLDEGQVAELFLKQFFPAYDGDRGTLVGTFYDAQSTFSLSVNTAAPRDPHQGDQVKQQAWDSYIKRSRNLSKITHLPARMSRVYTGPQAIRECWAALPATRHPNLLEQTQKWLIECHSLPGLPDPTNQSPTGVGGLTVVVHGEFEEMDVSAGQPIIQRSFDRSFILGPGGPTGIRVISDIITYRAYGGSEAWIPDDVPVLPATAATPAGTATPQPPALPLVAPSLAKQAQAPANFGVAVEGKTPEQVQRELMIVELSNRTSMTLEYSNMCLEESGFNFDQALVAFERVKVRLFFSFFLS
ncbi:MAG: hypothetical protein M1825_001821 [Sarcosagium campestre]|nr:MAG: hypothetical protein M1825_001821 [Sarcosagium campestre]